MARIVSAKNGYVEGLALLSAADRERAESVIAAAKFGSKGILEKLGKASLHARHQQAALAGVVASLDWIDHPDRSMKDPEATARTATRRMLLGKSDAELEAYCTKLSVSYVAFRNDKPGMIEALMDEMFGVEV